MRENDQSISESWWRSATSEMPLRLFSKPPTHILCSKMRISKCMEIYLWPACAGLPTALSAVPVRLSVLQLDCSLVVEASLFVLIGKRS